MLVELGDLPADKHLTRAQLSDLTAAMPPEWLPSASAVGSAATCAARLRDYVEAGADEIILHGTTGAALADLVRAFAAAPTHRSSPS
jgi:uncharacterized protein (DUF2237 family)